MRIGISSRVATFFAAASLALRLGRMFVVIQQNTAQARAAGGSDADQSSRVHGRHDLERNKRNAAAFYTTAFNDKNPRLAVELYGGDQYIQHNPLAQNGFEAFITFVETFTTAFPDAHIEIVRIVAEGDLVVTHALATGAVPVYTELGTKLVDIFRLDENSRVIEHWDVAAAISPTSENGNPEV